MRITPPEAISLIYKVLDRCLMALSKGSFREIGSNCIFHPTSSSFHYSKISIGDDVAIGDNARFWCSESSIKIGSHCVFAPNVSIIAGNHSFHIPGKFITDYSVADKRPEDDLPVVIEDDVWIGTNVAILNGVRVGRGAIIAAGSVVNKEVRPYEICGGVPAKCIGHRFKPEEILQHEKLLYPEEKRLTKSQIDSIFK